MVMGQARADESCGSSPLASSTFTPHRVVTYSRAHTLVPTYECFNRCTYCNFRTDPGQSPWVSLDQVARQMPLLHQQGVCEVLVLSG